MKITKTFFAILMGLTMIVSNASAKVTYEHVRNATAKLTYNETTFLIDPMLAEKGRYPGFEDCFNPELRNPLVELSESKESILENVDAVIVSHTHLDHWDEVAQQCLDKNIPVFAQDETDAATIRKQGFQNVRVLKNGTEFGGVTLEHIEATHGTQEMYNDPATANGLGESMGIVFHAKGEKTTYIMGDTVWTPRINKTLNAFHPDIIVMNTGYAKVLKYNDSIIMGTADVARAAAIMPKAKIVAVHMDAISHMTVSRSNMREFIRQQNLTKQVFIPNDSETIAF